MFPSLRLYDLVELSDPRVSDEIVSEFCQWHSVRPRTITSAKQREELGSSMDPRLSEP